MGQTSLVIGCNYTLNSRFVEDSYSHVERWIHEIEAVVQMLEEKYLQPLMSAAAGDNLEKIMSNKK